MTKHITNKVYLAKDVYSRWKSLVEEAKETITVFTPYFDRTLLSVLKANNDINLQQITIVTDFNPISILELPNQLRAIKQALSLGLNVLSLPCLHAKVLLIDRKYITTGSQNFTYRGRKNKECTTVPTESMEGTQFVNTLDNWLEQAKPIDESLVDLMLTKLGKQFKEYSVLVDKIQSEFTKLRVQHEKEKQNDIQLKVQEKQRAIRLGLVELEQKSRIKMSNGEVFASIKKFASSSGYYDSLVVFDNVDDLTSWTLTDEDDSIVSYELPRCKFYPIIVANSNRMAFVRIANRRITYVRTVVTRNWQVGDIYYDINIEFPATETCNINIVINISISGRGSCQFDVLFTGCSASIVGKRYIEFENIPYAKAIEYKRLIESSFFESTTHLDKLFKYCFTNFKYNTLGIDNKNLGDLLDGSIYKLGIIQYLKQPIIVINKYPW